MDHATNGEYGLLTNRVHFTHLGNVGCEQAIELLTGFEHGGWSLTVISRCHGGTRKLECVDIPEE